jgi:hypothetical protein
MTERSNRLAICANWVGTSPVPASILRVSAETPARRVASSNAVATDAACSRASACWARIKLADRSTLLKPKEIADSFPLSGWRFESMMGPRQVDQAALFYEFSLERHVPAGHLLRSIDRFVDLSEVRGHLAPFYSSTGRPSIDPELLVRMLLVGYCYGIRSERGSAGSASMARCRTTRPSPRIGMAASAIAICCASCSRPWSDAAWQKGWLMGRPLLSMPA